MGTVKLAQELLVTVLIALALFVPFIENLQNDVLYVICMTISYVILILHEHYRWVLPAYWSCTALTALVVPIFYKGVPTLLRNTALLGLLRSCHVGLLTSRSGYGTDVNLFRSKKFLYATLAFFGLTIDIGATYYIMQFLGYSQGASALMAAISPAPSPEMALPLFNSMISYCKPKHGDVNRGSEAETKKEARLEELRKELTEMQSVFKTTATILILTSIALFCAAASGIDFGVAASGSDLGVAIEGETRWLDMAMNLLKGVVTAMISCILFYFGGRLLVSKGVPPPAMALLLFITAYFSMYYLGQFVSVASALAAIWSCLSLRLSTGFDGNTAAILTMIWPFTSNLYYSTFAYAVVGYYTRQVPFFMDQWWKIIAGSLMPFLMKLVLITLASRGCKVSWPSSLTLALSLCTKGTVQIALCAAIPLKYGLKDSYDFAEDLFGLQLFVLLNYLLILILIQIIAKVIALWIRN